VGPPPASRTIVLDAVVTVFTVPIGILAAVSGLSYLVSGTAHGGRLSGALVLVYAVVTLWIGFTFAVGRATLRHLLPLAAALLGVTPLDGLIRSGEPKFELGSTVLATVVFAAGLAAVIRTRRAIRETA
jgi:hypothetical protein